MALGVTGYLSDRNHHYQEAIAIAKAQLQSQQLASIREDFVFTLSHDWKTPMLGAIETIKAFGSAKFWNVTALQQKVLETMARSHKMSLQLLETLLDVYRNDAEGLKLQLAPVNLVALAKEVIATISHLSGARPGYINCRDNKCIIGEVMRYSPGERLSLGSESAMNLIEAIKAVPDYRQKRGIRHPLWLILIIILFGSCTGYWGYKPLVDFTKKNRSTHKIIQPPARYSISRGKAIRKLLKYCTAIRGLCGFTCTRFYKS